MTGKLAERMTAVKEAAQARKVDFILEYPTVNRVLVEIGDAKWETFAIGIDKGDSLFLMLGTKIREDTWTIRCEDWDTGISLEIPECPYHVLMQTIPKLNNCFAWASFV